MKKTYRRSKTRRFTREQCSKGGSVCRGYETAEDARQRALHDAKGMVLRQGVTYTVKSGEVCADPWQKRRAVEGRTDQVEFVVSGRIVKTTGETLLRNQWRAFKGR